MDSVPACGISWALGRPIGGGGWGGGVSITPTCDILCLPYCRFPAVKMMMKMMAAAALRWTLIPHSPPPPLQASRPLCVPSSKPPASVFDVDNERVPPAAPPLTGLSGSAPPVCFSLKMKERALSCRRFVPSRRLCIMRTFLFSTLTFTWRTPLASANR